jgi:hypothetical protein
VYVTTCVVLQLIQVPPAIAILSCLSTAGRRHWRKEASGDEQFVCPSSSQTRNLDKAVLHLGFQGIPKPQALSLPLFFLERRRRTALHYIKKEKKGQNIESTRKEKIQLNSTQRTPTH